MEGACGGIPPPEDKETEEEREKRRKKNLKGPMAQGTAIIPANKNKWGKRNTVPKGKYILEFYYPATHQNKSIKPGEDYYIQHYAGFQGKRNKAGHCVPCCFNKWGADGTKWRSR